MRDVWLVILYALYDTMLTVACVVKMSDHGDIHGTEQLALWRLLSPCADNI